VSLFFCIHITHEHTIAVRNNQGYMTRKSRIGTFTPDAALLSDLRYQLVDAAINHC